MEYIWWLDLEHLMDRRKSHLSLKKAHGGLFAMIVESHSWNY